jgi:hypothetical protein
VQDNKQKFALECTSQGQTFWSGDFNTRFCIILKPEEGQIVKHQL